MSRPDERRVVAPEPSHRGSPERVTGSRNSASSRVASHSPGFVPVREHQADVRKRISRPCTAPSRGWRARFRPDRRWRCSGDRHRAPEPARALPAAVPRSGARARRSAAAPSSARRCHCFVHLRSWRAARLRTAEVAEPNCVHVETVEIGERLRHRLGREARSAGVSCSAVSTVLSTTPSMCSIR